LQRDGDVSSRRRQLDIGAERQQETGRELFERWRWPGMTYLVCPLNGPGERGEDGSRLMFAWRSVDIDESLEMEIEMELELFSTEVAPPVPR